ncbi:MAG: rRNA pseudouridine synthase [Bacteroidetes bacterium]|nr:MAG: rRNA pseudouridine synthase [Bacteroidota bacterium]
MRLNRFIARSGLCSRREADQYILRGEVKVNGQVVREMGVKVVPARDEVRFRDKPLQPERLVYILLNKPKNMITTTHDPQGRATVMQAIEAATDCRVFPVGRLDRNTTGLLLLTNDGELTKKLTHPSHRVPKLYHARLDREMEPEDMEKMLQGIELEDGPARVDKIDYVAGKDKNHIGLEVHIGRNRIVRRMFEALGYKVEALDRSMFAHLTKKNLPRGKWRMLTPKEIAFLKMK